MKVLIYLVFLSLLGSSLWANQCVSLFENSISKTEWNNALIRIRNVYKEDALLLQAPNGKEVLILFEGQKHYKNQERHKSIEFLADEVADLSSLGIRIRSIKNSIEKSMPIAEQFARPFSAKEIRGEKNRYDHKAFREQLLELYHNHYYKSLKEGFYASLPAITGMVTYAFTNASGKTALLAIGLASSSVLLFEVNLRLRKEINEAKASLRRETRHLTSLRDNMDLLNQSAAISVEAIKSHLHVAPEKSVVILPEILKHVFLDRAWKEGLNISDKAMYR